MRTGQTLALSALLGVVSELGPQNVQGFSPSLTLSPVRSLTLTLTDFFFGGKARKMALML